MKREELFLERVVSLGVLGRSGANAADVVPSPIFI